MISFLEDFDVFAFDLGSFFSSSCFGSSSAALTMLFLENDLVFFDFLEPLLISSY
jgi:hypothetical protein